MYIEEHQQGLAAQKHTHLKENFMKNKLRSHKIFAKCITF